MTAGMQTAALNDGVNLSGLTATPSHSCACSTAPTTTLACSTALGACASPAIVLEYVQVNTSSTIQPAFPLAWAADDIYCKRLCAHAGCAAMTRLIGRRQFRPAAGRSSSGLRGERGTSTIEFALGASLLFMTVVGIIAMLFALYSYNVVSESAREGTRYAIVRGSACHFASACPASQGDIQTYVRTSAFLASIPIS